MNKPLHQTTLDQNAKAPEQEAHHKREKLPAEKKFDKAVYGGISYFAQAATGIVLAHWGKFGSGRKYFDKIAQWAGPNIFEKITSKRGMEAVKEADSTIVVSTMIMVGNAFLLPVKWLENRKPQIVRSMTERENAKCEARGMTLTPEEKQHQETLLHELEAEPKQTWGSLLSGRAFGLGAVYAVLLGVLGNKNNQALENFAAKNITSAAEALGAKSLAKNKTFESYLRISLNDFFYSIISARGLYAYSHFIAPPKKHAAPRQLASPLEEAVNSVLDEETPTPNREAAPQPVMQPHALSHTAQPPMLESRI